MVKVVVLTGFLGAGKTTLLKRILAQSRVKCAVIQNELSEGHPYAEMGIESPVLTDASGEPLKEFYELSSGCICCSVRGTFLTTVERILTTRREIQLIVVETTGLADPVPLVTSFWLDRALESDVVLDGVVTLVDAVSFQKRLQESEYSDLFKRQLIVADRVLINKADLAQGETIETVREIVRGFNPTASLFMYRSPSTEHANIDLQHVSDINGLAKTDLPTGRARLHLHDVSLTQISVLVLTGEDLQTEGPVDGSAFERFLAEILWEREGKPYGNIIRGKGIVHVRDCEGIASLQM